MFEWDLEKDSRLTVWIGETKKCYDDNMLIVDKIEIAYISYWPKYRSTTCGVWEGLHEEDIPIEIWEKLQDMKGIVSDHQTEKKKSLERFIAELSGKYLNETVTETYG